jgi:hypothetical protein
MTGLTEPRGQLGLPNMPATDNRPRFRPHAPIAAAEGVLREMAFVLHLTRSVRAAMRGETRKATRPD